MKSLFISFCLFTAWLALPAYSQTQNLGPVKKLFLVHKIVIKGLKKVEREAILEKISIREGMTIDNYQLKGDISRIYDLKFFDGVEAYKQRSKGKNLLIFELKEKPIVKAIKVEGNSEIDDDEIFEQIKTKEFSILDINSLKEDVKSIQKFYEEKGFYLASVDFKMKQIDKENVEVEFQVKEFEQVRVKKVTFLGNRSFSDDQLKGIMETREESMFSWMTGAGNFKEFNFSTDIERMKFFYKTKGHLQVNVDTPDVTISEDKKWVFITVNIVEGPQFSINEISFNGELLFSEETLQKKISLKTGEMYSEENLRKDIQTLTELYQDEGYAFANVLRTLSPVPGENKVDIDFSFEKGKIAYFGKINIVGNTKTRDKVVRRELKIHEGERFSGSALRQSKENVTRLGYFEPNSVVFQTVTPRGKDNVLDVDISVKEGNTGQISLGAGYSTADKGFFQASITQNNFRGLGQILSLRVNWSSRNQTFQVGFTEPYFNDTKWTAGGDVFINQEESNSFDIKKRGFTTRVGYPIFDFTRLFLTYKFEDTNISNVQDERIDEDLENGVASSVDTTLVNDKRDNRQQPTKGHYASFSTEYAGVGGDKEWVRTQLDTRYYKRFYGEFVFRTRLKMSRLFQTNDDRDIPRSEKFFLGGSRNLRGFGFEDIGPKSTFTDDNDTPGDTSDDVERVFNTRGLFSVLSQIEIEHPLVREAGLKWVVFFDAGNVYEKYMGQNGDYDLRYDYGFGFRWFSPIGVLRFEFGFPLGKREDEASNQFHFDIGQLF